MKSGHGVCGREYRAAVERLHDFVEKGWPRASRSSWKTGCLPARKSPRWVKIVPAPGEDRPRFSPANPSLTPMALQQLSEEQISTWTRAQKDEWWFKNIYRGDMPQLTLRSAFTGFFLGGILSATALYIGGKTGITIGVGLPPESCFAMWVGAMIFWWQGRKNKTAGTKGHEFWVEGCEPICAGLISGAALVGIGNAIVNVLMD